MVDANILSLTPLTILMSLPFTITSFIILYDDGTTTTTIKEMPTLRPVRLIELYKLCGPPVDVPERYVVGCMGDLREAKRRHAKTIKWRKEEEVRVCVCVRLIACACACSCV